MINIHKNKHLLIKMCLHPLDELLSEGSEHQSNPAPATLSQEQQKAQGCGGREISVS